MNQIYFILIFLNCLQFKRESKHKMMETTSQSFDQSCNQFDQLGCLKASLKCKSIIIFMITICLLVFSCCCRSQISFLKDYSLNKNELLVDDKQFRILKNVQLDDQIGYYLQHSRKWHLPKFIWIYDSRVQQVYPQYNIFKTLNLLNTKRFAQQGKYTVISINKTNYASHLSPAASQNISSIVETIQKRIEDENYKNYHIEIQQNKEKIIKRLIIYFVLLEKGGIFIDDSATIVERFNTWLQDILNVPEINVGDKINSKIQPKCFGFFDKNFSSIRTKVNVKREFEFEKSLVIFPSLEDEFLACVPGSEFMQIMIETYIQILVREFKSERLQRLDKSQNRIGKTRPQQIYNYGHLLAIHSVLQQRQYFFDREEANLYQRYAIDDFGLITINSYYGPQKLSLSVSFPDRLYPFLTRMQLKELKLLVGQLRFVLFLGNKIFQQFQSQLQKPLTQTVFYMEKSLFCTYLFRYWPKTRTIKALNTPTLNSQPTNLPNLPASPGDAKVSIVSKPQIKQCTPESHINVDIPQWQSLDKHVWIIWDQGLKGKSNLLVELCFENLKRSAQNSGFQLHLVTKNNVRDYIDDQTLEKIQYAIQHANFEISQQAVTDLWRLALLYKHGGIYLDASTFMIDQSFDWLKNITRLPTYMIWNRYGKEPNVFMLWNAHWAFAPEWSIDKKWKTKSQWQLSYENNFIAAVKGTELIRQWIDVFLQWIVTPYDKMQLQMKKVGMYEYRWTREENRYLLAMDSLKYVIAKRQSLLKKSSSNEIQTASDYYKIWSMAGQMIGQLKFRAQSNFQNHDYRVHWIQRGYNNIFRQEYSQQYVQKVLGPISYLTKFFGYDAKNIIIKLENFYLSNQRNFNLTMLEQIFHPESVLSSKLLMKYPEKSLEVIKYYSNLRLIKVKLRANNKLSI